MKHIVIIGGGFAGVYAAKKLLKVHGVHVTLINKHNYFLFIPMLHEVATGGLSGHNLSEPIRDILNAKNFTFVKDTVQSVDLVKRMVMLANKTISYDYLILSTGSTTNFFGTKGAEENSFTLKNLEDAHAIRSQVIENVEKAFALNDEEMRKKLTSVAIIGAGPTGVELAIEMKEFLDQLIESNKTFKGKPTVYLIQKGEKVIPQLPELQKVAEKQLHKNRVQVLVNSQVKEVQKDKVIIADGQEISAGTIIWTAGVKANAVATTPAIANEKSCVVVNEYLQVPAFPEVFVIGDCASYTPQGSKNPVPALAQIASEQGKLVAKNLCLLLYKREMKPFEHKIKGTFISLGKGYGAGIVFGIRINGFLAWWMNRTIYLFKIIGTSNKLKTAWDWTLNLFTKRDACQH